MTTMKPVTARPVRQQTNRFMPVTDPPAISGSGVENPVSQLMVPATAMIDSTPVTIRPLYRAPMMLLVAPSLTK